MEPVSAFAVYSGHVNLSKNKKRRNRKKNLESMPRGRKHIGMIKSSQNSLKKHNSPRGIKTLKMISAVVKTNHYEITNSEISNGAPKNTGKNLAMSSGVGGKHLKQVEGRVQKKNITGKSDILMPGKSKAKKIKGPTKSKTISPSINSGKNSKSIKPSTVNQKKKNKILIEEAKKIVRAKTSSEHEGKKLFAALIHPHSIDDFMRDTWEKKPLYIQKGSSNFDDIISSQMIDKMVRNDVVLYGKHLDVTSYSNGVRETHNPEGRVHAHVMWDYYSNGCSIRLLNPQYFIHRLHALLATLQEYFGCLVGANAYLTPPNSQGFAPHYDDIEAFVIQIEGKKNWKVYQPRSSGESLPSFSSRNFTDDEIGLPILEVTLKPGDVLYFPRGFIHQANTVPGHHSLHVTVSTYQRTSWTDLLEKVLPLALKHASSNDIEYRKGLPLGYLRQAGLGIPKAPKKKELIQHLRKLVSKLEHYIDVDTGVDQMGLKFMHDALPPVLTTGELECSVYNDGIAMAENGELRNKVQLCFGTRIRFIRANCCRLVIEDVAVGETMERQLRLYYTVDNSREYHAEEPQFLVLPPESCKVVQYLISSYPAFVSVEDLPSPDHDSKINLASDLWERGLLMTDEPLEEQEENVEQFEEIINHSQNTVNSETESDESEIENTNEENMEEEEG